MKKKIIALSLTVCMVIFTLGIVGVAADSNVTIDEVVFTNGETTINEPEAGDITATGIITNNTGSPVDAILIVASYNANELCDVSLSYRPLNNGENEFESDPVTVIDALSIVKVLVWNQADMSPLVEPAYLKMLSSEKLIETFDVEMGGTTFEGDINQETKDIYVYVPTQRRGSLVDNLNYDGAVMNPAVFDAAKTAITPTISGAGTITATNGSTTQDFTSPVTYTVTAENGSTVTYTAQLVQTVLQRSTDFETAVEESIISRSTLPERWYMPSTVGHVGNGIWTAARYAFDSSGNYVTDTSTVVSYTDKSLTQTAITTGIISDPVGSGSKVFKFEKREAAKGVASVNIKSADSSSTHLSVSKVICEFDFMFQSLEGEGVFLRAAGSSVKNYQLIFSAQGASAGRYKLRSRAKDTVSVSDVPGMNELNFNSWYKLKLVHTSTATSPYTQKVEIYVDDEYVNTLENSGYTSNITTNDFNITYFGNPTFGTMYFDNWKLSFIQ